MAGDWIKVTVTLPEKPEVWLIAEELGLGVDDVVGKLIRVFAWFDAQSEDGNAPSVTEKLLDRLVGVTGFVQAMRSAGWILDDDEEIQLVNFDKHMSKSAKRRAQGADRTRKHRNASVTRDASPEKRREEKNIPAARKGDGRRKRSTRDMSLEECLSDKSWAEGINT